MKEAMVVCTEEHLPYGLGLRMRFEWQGDPSAVARIDRRMIRVMEHQGASFPWPLMEVEGGPRDGLYAPLTGYFIRRDVRGSWLRAADHNLRARLVNWSMWTGARLVATCAVWGLATSEPNRVPSWRDIHVLRRAADALARSRRVSQ